MEHLSAGDYTASFLLPPSDNGGVLSVLNDKYYHYVYVQFWSFLLFPFLTPNLSI